MKFHIFLDFSPISTLNYPKITIIAIKSKLIEESIWISIQFHKQTKIHKNNNRLLHKSPQKTNELTSYHPNTTPDLTTTLQKSRNISKIPKIYQKLILSTNTRTITSILNLQTYPQTSKVRRRWEKQKYRRKFYVNFNSSNKPRAFNLLHDGLALSQCRWLIHSHNVGRTLYRRPRGRPWFLGHQPPAVLRC